MVSEPNVNLGPKQQNNKTTAMDKKRKGPSGDKRRKGGKGGKGLGGGGGGGDGGGGKPRNEKERGSWLVDGNESGRSREKRKERESRQGKKRLRCWTLDTPYGIRP